MRQHPDGVPSWYGRINTRALTHRDSNGNDVLLWRVAPGDPAHDDDEGITGVGFGPVNASFRRGPRG